MPVIDDRRQRDNACSVCLGDYEEGELIRRLLPCHHEFHASCVDLWLKNRRTCPLCRLSMVKAEEAGADSPGEPGSRSRGGGGNSTVTPPARQDQRSSVRLGGLLRFGRARPLLPTQAEGAAAGSQSRGSLTQPVTSQSLEVEGQ